ncbi:MAG: L-ribulose-5-phosphate 4-epimerase [Lentisphaeria bacterium]|nr:L-ribulose-5-phosphate 4-epimerase [Lentisphaeria bacterium]
MYSKLQQECLEANLQLPKLGLVLYTFGNVSCADRELGVFAIKPSGVSYEELKAEDIVIVNFDGEVVYGNLRPSSDTQSHAVLYRHFPDINGIVHTHSFYATSWAQAKRDIPIYGTTHADHLPLYIPCTEFMSDDRINGDYEVETGLQIIDHFKKNNLNPNEVEMVLVGGHGPFTWGKNATEALYNARVLEELAGMAIFTEQINPEITELKKSIINKHYQRKHGKDAYYGQK